MLIEGILNVFHFNRIRSKVHVNSLGERNKNNVYITGSENHTAHNSSHHSIIPASYEGLHIPAAPAYVNMTSVFVFLYRKLFGSFRETLKAS